MPPAKKVPEQTFGGDTEAQVRVLSIPVKRDHVPQHDPADVSFVLERKGPEGTDSSGSKLGLFSIALVMCVCCIQTFFTPTGAAPGSKKGTASGING